MTSQLLSSTDDERLKAMLVLGIVVEEDACDHCDRQNPEKV